MSIHSLKKLVTKKLTESFEEQWDRDRPTRFEVVEWGEKVGLLLFAQKSDGNWSLIHDEPPIYLETEVDVDDLLARALSIFLMKHPEWLR
ncbi:MAG: hypothetical protein NPIRA04_05800 [Nitrospirales bacterium]|nr:MAG: hypothetical protein NPIRA04_05800 [Nitrospirales bacterium]